MESHPVIRQSWDTGRRRSLKNVSRAHSDFMATHTNICQTFAEKNHPKKPYTSIRPGWSNSPQKPVTRRDPPKRTIHTRRPFFITLPSTQARQQHDITPPNRQVFYHVTRRKRQQHMSTLLYDIVCGLPSVRSS